MYATKVNQVENHSYYVQQLAQQAWLRTKTACSIYIIDYSLQSIKNQLSLLFIGMTESLSTKQLYFLRAIIDITAKSIEIQDPVFKLWLKQEYFKINATSLF